MSGIMFDGSTSELVDRGLRLIFRGKLDLVFGAGAKTDFVL
ncbi:MAG: hypothetical protein ACLFUF_07770 [Opitutales bacterium]